MGFIRNIVSHNSFEMHFTSLEETEALRRAWRWGAVKESSTLDAPMEAMEATRTFPLAPRLPDGTALEARPQRLFLPREKPRLSASSFQGSARKIKDLRRGLDES